MNAFDNANVHTPRAVDYAILKARLRRRIRRVQQLIGENAAGLAREHKAGDKVAMPCK